jgi:sortase (surface protein transpeptidase)
MTTNRPHHKIIKWMAALLAVAAVCIAGWWLYSGQQGSAKADSVMRTLHEIVPGLGDESTDSAGVGRDPLAAINIEGVDIVGVLEIPALNINAPVTSKDCSEEYFASWLDGSPVQGHFMVKGGRDDLFRKLAKLKPGDRVTFTDIDGVQYRYEVTTQYHLKKWDVGENQMQLCYETTDDDTYFVVGCGAAQ